MATSMINKSPLIIQRNSRTSFQGTFGSKLGGPIDRVGLIAELALKFTISAAFQVAATSVDVRQFIERITLRSNDGDIVGGLSGQQIFDITRLTEDPATPVFTPGAGAGATGSVIFGQEIHLELDGAYFDLMTAAKGRDLSKLDIEVEIASQAKIQALAFVGSTFAAAPAFSVQMDVENYTYPAMENRSDVGLQVHYTVAKELSSAQTGRQTIELDPSNLTRFIGMHVDTVAGGVNAAIPSDVAVTDVTLKQGNRVIRDTDFRAMRFATQQKRQLSVVGFAALDFGDFEEGFCPLTGEPVQLSFNVPAGTPAWRVQVTQDYKKDRENHRREH